MAGKFALVIPTITIAEYHTSKELDTNKGYQKSKKYLELFRHQDLTTDIAEILGRLLRRKTYPSSANIADLIVASTAIYLNAYLATRNQSDFAKMPDLRFFDLKLR